jgi:uncharacterized lipoprotein YajG
MLPSVIGREDEIMLLNASNPAMVASCKAIVNECHGFFGVYDVRTFKAMESATLQGMLTKAGADSSMQGLIENAMGHKFERIKVSSAAFRSEYHGPQVRAHQGLERCVSE